METEILNGATKEDIDSLTDKVEIATEVFGKIKSKDDIIKGNKKEFTKTIVEAMNYAFPNENTIREEKLLKTLFNKILKSFIETDTTEENDYIVSGFLRKRIEDLVMLIYVYKYIENDSIEKMFEEYGIKLNFEPIEKILPSLAEENNKRNIKQLIELSTELELQNYNDETKINEEVYMEVPAVLRFNKQANPVGITKNTFKKFSLLNLLKKINSAKAQEKFNNMLEEAETKSKSDTLAVSIADTIVSSDKEVK